MKKICVLMCLFTVSCTSNSDPTMGDEDMATKQVTNEISQNVSSKKFFVPLESATMYASSFHFNGEKVSRPIDSVVPFVSGTDTLMYLVNYASPKNGWIVISADARLKPILAISEKKTMRKEDIDSGHYFSLNEYMNITKALQNVASGDTLSVTYTMWQNMKMMTRPINERLTTRQLLPPDTEIPGSGSGGESGSGSGSGGGSTYYDKILIDSWVEYTSNKKVDKLTTTEWGQSMPWNQRVPRVGDTEEHCVAGCVAVAGAQLFYYLHNKWGVPKYMYKSGGKRNWTDDVDKSYFTDQDTLWSVMGQKAYLYSLPSSYQYDKTHYGMYHLDRPEYLYPALLIAYVGDLVDTSYGEKESGAKMKDLGYALGQVGIYSNYSEYDEDIIKQSLDNGLPVCISACCTKHDIKIYPGTVYSYYKDGHAWLIDGYKDIQNVYHYRYAWVTPGTVIPSEESSELDYKNCPKTTTSVPGTTQRVWYMNFGWYGNHDDETFSMDNDVWTVTDIDKDGKKTIDNYRYKKRILYNFKIEE